jgi:hypothetical protein
VLALLEWENERLIDRQAGMFQSDMPVWKQWEQACDYLEDDLASGYVRLLQEMTAAGWSDGDVARAVRKILASWFDLLTDTAAEAEQRFGNLGPFTASEIAVLAGVALLGAEELILLGFEEKDLPARAALRKVGAMLRTFEETR